MAEPMDYPMPELLAKIAEIATTFRDFQRTAAPCDLNSTTTNIKDMMNPERLNYPWTGTSWALSYTGGL